MIGHAPHPRTQPPAKEPAPWVLPDFASKPTPSAKGTRPQHCCVYCGNALYVPHKATNVHCPKCYRQIPVKDIVLTGIVTQERFLTAGKITVAEGAQITAELVACHIELAGEVRGTILASQSCTVRPTARHIGMLLTRYLDIQNGAALNSEIEIIRD